MLADPRFRLPVVLVGALLLHMTLFSNIRFFGVMPDVMLLVAIAAGLAGGPTVGAVMGFASGILADLLLPTPLGLSALVFTVTGYIVGIAQGGLLKAAWWFPVTVAGVASGAAILLFATAGTIIGQGGLLNMHLVAVLVVVAIVNGTLILPALKTVRWALAGVPARALAE